MPRLIECGDPASTSLEETIETLGDKGFDPEDEANWSLFTFELAGDAAPEAIEIRYVNDEADDETGDDRSLWVDYIALDGTVLEAEINPLLVKTEGVVAVDALLVLQKSVS